MTHRAFAAIPVAVMLLGAAAGSAPAQTSTIVRVVGRAPIMSRPSGDAQVVLTVDAGTLMDVVDSDGGWYWVTLPPDAARSRRRGWIQAKDVDVVNAPPASPATSAPSLAVPGTIYVQPTDDGFQTYIVAAIIKKKVPANVVGREELASLILKAARVEVHEESTGAKVVKCLFAYCADINDKANTSVQLVDAGGKIVWSYSVNKGRGAKNRQSLAEAIASHLKSEYFRR
jgi:hypothetical protein